MSESTPQKSIVFSSMGRGYWPSEDILSVVHCVDDLLEYKAIQAGQEGWTECYREYCKGKSESLPKIPSEGFRIYAPMHSGFTTINNDEGHATRMTSYYQTMSGGDGTYAESGYFVRVFYHHDADWNKSHAIKTEVYEAKRKPLGQFECKYIRNAYPILSYINGSAKPSMIQIAIEVLDK